MLVHSSASGAKDLKGGQLEAKLRNVEEFRSHGMSLQNARLAWRLYLADATDVTATPKHEKKDTLTTPASPVASSAIADVLVSPERLPSSSAMPSEEKD